MIRSKFCTRSYLALALLLASSCVAQVTIDGEWIGGYRAKGGWLSLKAQFKTGPGGTSATLQVQGLAGRAMDLAPATITLDGDAVRLKAPKESDTLILEGRVRNGRLAGHFQDAGEQGAFELLRVTPPDSKLFASYSGSYRLGPESFVSVGPQSPNGDNLRLGYVERISQRRGVLNALSDTEFVGGPALGFDYPLDVRINFLKNASGEVTALKWKHGNAPEKVASRIGIRQEEVSFRSGDITLSGTLLLPATKGHHPTVVLIHGSTPLVRTYFGPDPYMYPVYGVAVLFYDKRGTGSSTGNRTEGIQDLASDALAGVEYLKSHPEIDRNQIGLYGHSEGGWVVPEAAARSKELSFIIAGAASGLSRQENKLHEVDGNLRFFGFSPSVREQAIALLKLRNEVMAANGEGWNTWRDEVAKVRNEKWFPLAGQPPSISEMNEGTRARLMNYVAGERRWWYDPVPAWQKITIPVLVYESEWDWSVPAQRSAEIIGAALTGAGNKDYTIKVFPKSNHGQWATQTDGPNNRLSHKVKYDVVFDWLLNHVKVAKIDASRRR